MSKQKMTYQDVMILGSVCEKYLSKCDESGETTELGETVRGFLKKQVIPLQTEYNDELQLIRVQNAYTDDKGVLLKEADGGFKYTKDGETKKLEQLKELRNKEVEVHTRILTTRPPSNLTLEEKDYFTGIFLPHPVPQTNN